MFSGWVSAASSTTSQIWFLAEAAPPGRREGAGHVTAPPLKRGTRDSNLQPTGRNSLKRAASCTRPDPLLVPVPSSIQAAPVRLFSIATVALTRRAAAAALTHSPVRSH